MPIFDKIKIQFNFNRAANNYDKFAELQKIVAGNLVQICKKYILKADNILDLGCGTGFVAKNILSGGAEFEQKKITQLDIAGDIISDFGKKNLFNVNADIEVLPFKSQSFDLVFSSLAFHWLNDLDLAISKIIDIIRPKSTLAFSIIADGSLKELRTACEKCEVDLSINNFITKDQLNKILSNKFSNFQIKEETITLKYDDGISLIKSIKSIGAGYSFSKNNLRRKDFNKINNFYLKNFNSNNRVFADWRIFYVICTL